MRVLLIESEPEDTVFLRDVLTEIGEGRYWNNWVNIEVVEAASWEDPSPILARENIDIVLLDLDVVDSHGVATFRLVQRAAPHIPIVLLIAPSEESFGLRLVRDGAQDFLVKKQVDCAPLAHAMRNAIERHRLLTAARASSTHDTLTGLLNREGFLACADRDRKIAEKLGRRLMVMIAEPENLGEIATAYGEQTRDLALVEAADHLRAVAESADLLARIESVRFGISVFESESEPLEATETRIRAALRLNRIKAGAAIFAPDRLETLDGLLAEAIHDVAPNALATHS